MISEAVKPIPFEFCQDCGHTVYELHECVKVKFKMFKQIDERQVYTIVGYNENNMKHKIVNNYGTFYLVDLRRDIGFIDGYSLIGKQIVRKVKKYLPKKSKG